MKQTRSTAAIALLVAASMPAAAQVGSAAAVTGVVRDAHGTPQLGALVELLSNDATTIARVITDEHGKYAFQSVAPGTYQVRVSAAFLIPTLKSNLRLKSGSHALADLTMTAIFEAGAWLPTERRGTLEPRDDWRWTLRSSANRPLLRLTSDSAASTSDQQESSSSAEHRRDTLAGGQVALVAGDGSFAEGGNRQVITLGRAATDDVSLIRADLGNAVLGGTNSVVIGAGVEHRRAWGGGTHLFAGFSSHPEVQTGNGEGLQILHTAATESIVLGDAVMIDAGSLFTAEKLISSRIGSSPFFRVAYSPSSEYTVEYRLATNRALQSSADLDDASLQDSLMLGTDGRPVIGDGLHQELALEHKGERRTLSVAAYRDTAATRDLQGGGLLGQQDLVGIPILYDPVTDTLELAVRGGAMSGVHMSWMETLSPNVSAGIEGSIGTALTLEDAAAGFSAVQSSTKARATGAVVGKVALKTERTGTHLEATYHWQPGHTLTAVDEFDTARGNAYLGVRFRQRLSSGRRIKRLDAMAEATNLLAEGYVPVVGPDGQTLFLAQSPRALQAGLAFTF